MERGLQGRRAEEAQRRGAGGVRPPWEQTGRCLSTENVPGCEMTEPAGGLEGRPVASGRPLELSQSG